MQVWTWHCTFGFNQWCWTQNLNDRLIHQHRLHHPQLPSYPWIILTQEICVRLILLIAYHHWFWSGALTATSMWWSLRLTRNVPSVGHMICLTNSVETRACASGRTKLGLHHGCTSPMSVSSSLSVSCPMVCVVSSLSLSLSSIWVLNKLKYVLSSACMGEVIEYVCF